MEELLLYYRRKSRRKEKEKYLFCRTISKKIGEKEYYMFDANQYSSPTGKRIGNYNSPYYYKPSGGMHI